MKIIALRWRWALEPTVGAAFGLYWLVSEASRTSFDIGARGHSIAWITVILLLAIAIAVARVRAELSLFMLVSVLIGQFAIPQARFEDSVWLAYIALPLTTLFVARYVAPELRGPAIWILGIVIVGMGILLCAPGFAVGVDWDRPDLASVVGRGVIAVAIGAAAVATAWLVGSRFRVPLAVTTERDDELRSLELSRLLDRNRDLVASLSSREREVFMLAARGMSNSEIAGAAYISEATVKSHMSRILAKLGFTSRVQIVALAYENHLLDEVLTGDADRYAHD
jgi:DNA-binding CsgD family transcriptional regulator